MEEGFAEIISHMNGPMASGSGRTSLREEDVQDDNASLEEILEIKKKFPFSSTVDFENFEAQLCLDDNNFKEIAVSHYYSSQI